MEVDPADSEVAAPVPQFPQVSRFLPRAVLVLILVMLVCLGQAWWDSMATYRRVEVPVGSAQVGANSLAGRLYLFMDLGGATFKGKNYSEGPFFTPVNQETLFPRPETGSSDGTKSPTYHFIALPYWLLMVLGLFAGVVFPGAWRRWRRPKPGKSPRRRVMVWLTGWAIPSLAILIAARAWINREPRIDRTAKYELTGTLDPKGVPGKMRGVVLHRDGSTAFDVWILTNSGARFKTDWRGEFELTYQPAEALIQVDRDRVMIRVDPERPMFWRIQER